MKVNKTRRQTASKRPGKNDPINKNRIGFCGGIDDKIDIERCLSCDLPEQECDGMCAPKRFLDNMPDGFREDVKAGMSSEMLCRKYKIGCERVRMTKNTILRHRG